MLSSLLALLPALVTGTGVGPFGDVAERTSGPAAVATATATAAAVRSWHIEDFHADVHVHSTARIEVTERIRVRFEGSYQGIYRDVPIEYRQALGFNYTLRLSDIEVSDAQGNELRFETSRERHYRRIKIWVPDARDAARTVRIRYTVHNGLRWFEEEDRAWTEFYWNVTGDEWPVPIDEASARIQLPPEATGVRARAFTGGYGSTQDDATVDVDGSTIEVETVGSLGIQEGLTVTVALDTRVNGDPDGAYIIAPPTTLEKIVGWLNSNWPIFIPVLVFFLMFNLWSRYGRDPEQRPITTRYEPPETLTVSEAGALIDNRVDMRDVTSMIVDLAVRGYLRIRKEEGATFLGFNVGGDTYEFELLRDRPEWTDLTKHEVLLLDALFDGRAGDTVTTSDLKNRFYKHLPGIKDALWKTLVGHGMYRSRPDHVLAIWLVLAAVVGVGGAFFSVAALSAIGVAPITGVVAAALSGIVVAAFGAFMPARTRAGTRRLEEVLGFEEFLDRVESDRFKRLITGPEMFERYLPFAMAFGVEEKWAAAFADMYRDQQPTWYVGPGGTRFHASALSSDLSSMASSTATAMQSSPRSSSGSGLSGGGGGGFSGGGFGGGGGGAF